MHHRGIRIDSIPVQGVGGLIFAAGSLLLLLIGVPAMRLFFLGSLLCGAACFGLMRWLRRT